MNKTTIIIIVVAVVLLIVVVVVMKRNAAKKQAEQQQQMQLMLAGQGAGQQGTGPTRFIDFLGASLPGLIAAFQKPKLTASQKAECIANPVECCQRHPELCKNGVPNV